MSLKKLMSILCMLAISVIVFTACESEDEVEGPGIVPITVSPAGTMLVGQSGDNAITVQWEASPSQNQSWFAGYELVISAQGELDVTIPFSTLHNQLWYECTGLNATRTYTFEVRAVGIQPEDSSVVRSTPNTITWALATHFTLNENQAEIRAFGTNSSFGSGIQIYGPLNAPRSLLVASGEHWNLGLSTRNGDIHFGSASKLQYPTVNPSQEALITLPLEDSDNLNSSLRESDLSNLDFQSRFIDLKAIASNYSKGAVFYAKVGNHYAKVIVLKANATSFLHNAGTHDEYVRLLISYQTRINQPYAKPSN